MIGKYFVYLLKRNDAICCKLGRTRALAPRIKRLNSKFGPLSIEQSLVFRADNEKEAIQVETALKNIYFPWKFPLPRIYNSTDGESEWYADSCYSNMKKTLSQIAQIRHGEAYRITTLYEHLNIELGASGQAKCEEIKNLLQLKKSQVNSITSALQGVSEFKLLFEKIIPHFQGVGRTINSDGSFEYNVYFKGSFSCDMAQEFTSASRVSFENDEEESFIHTNLCLSVGCKEGLNYLHYSIPSDNKHSDLTKQSQEIVERYKSLLEDLTNHFPISRSDFDENEADLVFGKHFSELYTNLFDVFDCDD
ncbi:hypothetical protein EJ063_19585 [Vibrio aquaticus]|uniref:Uncharacterized protein n=1 Tax=Vibrio aquaticus TaxID=2496559 RepID=A0A3S0QAZ7_9VIBR|nr:hypothetical protein [Vibrio aquaticus]RTZ13610.1 hypothetical protein EJ063_19585 [Vibrio aquaticus]